MLTTPVDVHIGMATYELLVAPYATKDFGVSACATIATWLATEVAARNSGLPLTSSFDITRLAAGGGNENGAGVLPQRFGLDPAQISRALLTLGFQPFVYDLENFPWATRDDFWLPLQRSP
ncbi:MAG: hypothetical protein IPH65_02295 [Dehalococcoidia bacterium]|uniref:hypothetical protein n=1 Tax=Candidatus Amarobacter glycogenicus TaxID=3140699 RepID=UPI003136C4DD|nr:hypothetical protein [Dehalococcoidia bacterium]